MAVMSLEQGLSVLAGRARILRVILWTYIAFSAVVVADWCALIASGIDQNNLENPTVIISGFLALGLVALFIVCIVAVCLWVYRAHANLFAAGLDGLEFTPGWSVGWFFVPFAFWFKPFQAMRELWNASHLQSDGYSAPADSRLTIWWGFWVTGNITLNVSMRMSGMSGSINVLDVIGYGLLGMAAWFFLQIINGVTRAQLSEMEAAHAFA